eukprot:251559-Hanusia_phi.AAC.1
MLEGGLGGRKKGVRELHSRVEDCNFKPAGYTQCIFTRRIYTAYSTIDYPHQPYLFFHRTYLSLRAVFPSICVYASPSHSAMVYY